ncbi:hypothetical protein [Pseudomonas sp. Leaf58]|uniref:hypothetical protein n=1 Tax=Pseudomonas sp. Leaf58 TaxID=1736226 RepID=UPI000AFF63B2|nr:hypothetical protein [Pseudomonas sp. Leaf58]
MEITKTLKLRIKDKHAKAMLAMARDVNQVWNFCNETQFRSLKRYCNKPKTWLSGFDLQKLTNGFSKCEGVTIGSATQQQVCEEFATRLRQFKRQRLNWRASDRKSPKYSLGWGALQGPRRHLSKWPGAFQRHQYRPMGFLRAVEVHLESR